MLYYLFNYLDQLDFPGAGMFKYVSFRSGLALILSLFISTAIGRRIIDKLQMLQIGETVRNLGLEPDEQEGNANDGRYYHYYRYIDPDFTVCQAE